MNDNTKNNPSDFNLFIASDFLLGVLESIHRMTTEEPPEDELERERWMNALYGLAWAGVKTAREMNRFLTVASDMHRLPTTYADIGGEKHGLREPARSFYVVR